MKEAARRNAEVLSSDVLHLILLPTEACNFRCTYCYEDFRLGRMTGDVIAGIEALLSRRAPGLRSLDISWFGGEPLLAGGVVLRILRHVATLRREHPALRFRSDMTTNGHGLDRGLFAQLHALGVTRYHVSFDGLSGDHDRKRVRIGGGGSFDRIWGNLLALKALPLAFTIAIRLHLDRENLGACRSFVARLRQDFEGDPRFLLHPRLLSRWGGPNDAELAVFEECEGRKAVDELGRFAAAAGVALYKASGEDTICYAARGNSFVIRADGRVNKCTLALEAPVNQVGSLSSDGRLSIDATRMTPWMRGLWSGSVEALQCPMQGLTRTEPAGERA